jgi:hypothetical protein
LLHDDARQARTVYRCNFCRLALVVDRGIDQLVLAPSQPPEQPHKRTAA